MAQWHGRERRFDEAIRKLYYDTCLYTKNALELLFESVGMDRCLYGTEVPGAGTHPDTGEQMDHLVPVIESIEWLTADDKKKIFEDNARQLYRLKVYELTLTAEIHCHSMRRVTDGDADGCLPSAADQRMRPGDPGCDVIPELYPIDNDIIISSATSVTSPRTIWTTLSAQSAPIW